MQMNGQLAAQESRHKLARDICHGKSSQITQAYRTGVGGSARRARPGAERRGPVDTRYLDAAVAHLRALPSQDQHDVLDEDVAHVSPLGHASLNCRGRYFAAAPPREGLRRLRDPATVHLGEDDGGEE